MKTTSLYSKKVINYFTCLMAFSLLFFGNSIRANNPNLPKVKGNWSYEVLKNKTIVLNWETQLKQQNDNFVLERSADGINFQAILKENIDLNTNSIMTYQTWDKNPFPGLNYYRLKIFTEENQSHYSSIQAIDLNQYARNNSLSMQTNLNVFDINFIDRMNQGKVLLFDKAGRLVLSHPLSRDNFKRDFQKIQWPKGDFLLRISSAEISLDHKISL